MTARNIGGPIDWAVLYGRDQHRPTDSQAMAAEIRRLRGEGLMPRDIADTLRLGLGAVLTALRTGQP
jgi:hypothetical protein